MATVLINATPGTFPEGFCPTGPTALQDLYNEIIERTVFSLSADKAFYNYGDTEPTPENRVFPWLRTVAGAPERWYVYSGGYWSWPYRVPIGSGERIIWTGSEADLWLYDGGDGSNPGSVAPTAWTGSFWEVDTAFAYRVPIGVGTLPSGTALAVGDTGGEEKHVLTTAELPAHTHGPNSTADAILGHANGGTGGVYNVGAGIDTAAMAATGETGGGEGHNNLQPYKVVYFAKRTVRQFWTP